MIKDGELALHLREYDDIENDVLVRKQEIAVIRNDKLHKESEIIPNSTCPPFNIMAGFEEGGRITSEDTAGDLREMANAHRESMFMESMLAEKAENSTLIEDLYKFNEMQRHINKTHSRTIRSLLAYTE